MLGFGANAIVPAGHALVAEVADTRRISVLNLLDICFGLGLASLPLVVQALQRQGVLELIFWSLGAFPTSVGLASSMATSLSQTRQ